MRTGPPLVMANGERLEKFSWLAILKNSIYQANPDLFP
jgi:hypothetical protein